MIYRIDDTQPAGGASAYSSNVGSHCAAQLTALITKDLFMT
jgi:hypothetical protein